MYLDYFITYYYSMRIEVYLSWVFLSHLTLRSHSLGVIVRIHIYPFSRVLSSLFLLND